MQVNSTPPGSPPEEHFRLIIQGASIVHFANAYLDAYKKEKTFVFVAIFITGFGEANRYFLYQNKDSRMVCTHVPYIIKSYAETP